MSADASNQSPASLLVVDDSQDDVFLLKYALKKAQLDVPLDVCSDGQHAIDYLREIAPGGTLPLGMLLDIRMPRRDGFDVLQWRRTQPHLAALPIIMLTASPEIREVERAFQLGACAYLVKPAQTDELRRALQLMRGQAGIEPPGLRPAGQPVQDVSPEMNA